MFVILVHRIFRRGTFPLPLVNLVELDFLYVNAWWEFLHRLSWRKSLLQERKGLGIDVVGELNRYVNEEVTRLVVSL